MPRPFRPPSVVTLLTNPELERSGVVANNRMNRERLLVGPNGYDKELGFNPVQLLRQKAASSECVRWLDLCCGSGRALIDAAHIVHAEKLDPTIKIIGVDLVGVFSPVSTELSCLRFIEASLTSWRPEKLFDLISCVHGLHYIGDKLGLIQQAASWLKVNGQFVTNLSLENVKFQDGSPASRCVATELRKAGLLYDGRRKRLVCDGYKRVELPFRYLGADDQPGPNYTGQPAVDSYYEWLA
ncbi:MAG: class I SAM-dependent methyltransferase [Planctomycetota bacterium]